MEGVSGGLWLDSSRLETVLLEDIWSSLSNGLKKKIKGKRVEICRVKDGGWGLKASAPPGDLQIQLHRPKVIDVHGQRLGERAEKVEHFAGHTPHHHMIGQALELRHLGNKSRGRCFTEKTCFCLRRGLLSRPGGALPLWGWSHYLDWQQFCDERQKDVLFTVPHLLVTDFHAASQPPPLPPVTHENLWVGGETQMKCSGLQRLSNVRACVR